MVDDGCHVENTIYNGVMFIGMYPSKDLCQPKQHTYGVQMPDLR